MDRDGEGGGAGVAVASVARQVTVVVPTGKVDPEAGVQVGVSGPSTLSVAVAENVTSPRRARSPRR